MLMNRNAMSQNAWTCLIVAFIAPSGSEKESDLKSHYEQKLSELQKNLQRQREETIRVQLELSAQKEKVIESSFRIPLFVLIL